VGKGGVAPSRIAGGAGQARAAQDAGLAAAATDVLGKIGGFGHGVIAEMAASLLAADWSAVANAIRTGSDQAVAAALGASAQPGGPRDVGQVEMAIRAGVGAAARPRRPARPSARARRPASTSTRSPAGPSRWSTTPSPPPTRPPGRRRRRRG